MMRKEKFMYGLLLLASLWVLVLTAVPHHHHTDGSLCIARCEALPAAAHAHAHGCDLKTGNHPQMIVEETSSRTRNVAASIPCLASILSFYLPLPPDASVLIPDFPSIYRETLHSVWIVESSGLRAPPAPFALQF